MLVNTILDRDTAITLRDGERVYADIYSLKSSDGTKFPAVICWSPYGKSSVSLDMLYNRSGIPKSWTSGYETFEGLNPASWCSRGCAVVNVDARGAQFSSGSFFVWELQETEDIYDTIEFLSNSTGAVDSFRHPALKAIAPWEGFNDIYRQLLFRDGFPMNNDFPHNYQWAIAGGHEVEDMEAMVASHPLFDSYWEDKYDEVEKIETPMYVLASFNNPFHIQGSFNTFRQSRSQKKWLRIHSTFEWYEMYEQRSNDDLQEFFDRYCKGIENGWEDDTPRVRLSLLGCGSVPNIVERPEAELPLQRQRLTTFYLDGRSHTLKKSQDQDEHSIAYDAHHEDATSDFVLRFDSYTEVAGYAKARLWMSCTEKDDMDVVVQIRKIDKTGRLLEGINIPTPDPPEDVPRTAVCKFLGPDGFLRASFLPSRDDSKASKDRQEIFYNFDQQEKVAPGTVVPMQITLWPTGMVFAKGEGIQLRITGHVLAAPVRVATVSQEPQNANLGQHCIHTGGKFDSRLILPTISGDRK